MRCLSVLVVLLALAFVPACGGSADAPGGVPGTFSRGPVAFAMPFLPTVEGETLVLGLTNLAALPAPVTVTAFAPSGMAYPGGATTVVLDPRGSARFPLSSFTGIGTTLGGWLEVETRDLGTLDPVTGIPEALPTSGLVVPVMTRSQAAIENDASGGIAFRATRAEVTVNEYTTSVQLINASWLPMAGGALGEDATFDVIVYDAFGDVESFTPATVPAYGSVRIDLGTTDVGQVQVVPTTGAGQVAPAGTAYRFAIASLEDDPVVHFESRYLQPTDFAPGQFDVGFDLAWGVDADFNIHDFGVYLSNPTASPITVQLTSLTTADGANLIPSPRLIALDAHATKYMAASTIESRGLDTGEVSVFQDVFGLVDFATSLTRFTARFSIPDEANVSARDFDSRFKSYYRVLPGYRQTTDVVIPVMDYQIVATGGIRNYAVFSNPFPSIVTVNIRGYTPGGTEYILAPVTVGPQAMLFWSPDGLLFREDPTDVTAPPVPFMSFQFSASGGIFFDGVRERVDAAGLILYRRSFVVRNLRAD